MRKLKKHILFLTMLIVTSIPLLVSAASTNSTTGVSGLAVAQYKLEGAQQQGWTPLPISSSSRTNSQNISVTTPGTTVVTLYAEDRAGNQNYTIKTVVLGQSNQNAPIDHITYQLTGATDRAWTTYTGPITITNEGETYLTAQVYDQAGNVTTVNQTIRVDKSSPINGKAIITLQ